MLYNVLVQDACSMDIYICPAETCITNTLSSKRYETLVACGSIGRIIHAMERLRNSDFLVTRSTTSKAWHRYTFYQSGHEFSFT